MQDWYNDPTLVQGSDAWKRARTHRVGGSDIAVIMRISPYKTRLQLWEERTGRRPTADISRLAHVQRGIKAEPIARGMLEKRHQVTYSTPVLIHPKHEWAVASLDGICTDHTLEIKTMGAEKHLDVRDGIIPDYYRAQVLWGLCVSGKGRGLFASYRPEDGSLYEVWIERDKEWEVEALKAGAEFMDWVAKDVRPPDDFVYMGDGL
jgi:putative phage-type endonuclease